MARISMLYLYAEVPFVCSREYVRGILALANQNLGGKIAVHHCIASTLCTGLECLHLLLGLRSSLDLDTSDYQSLCSRLTATFEKFESDKASYLIVTPIQSIAAWHQQRDTLEKLIAKEGMPEYSCIFGNLLTYKPVVKVVKPEISYASVAKYPEVKGYCLKYEKSTLEDVFRYILNRPGVGNFSMMMSRESHVYLVLILSGADTIIQGRESLSCLADVPVDFKEVKTLKHFHNIVAKHRECGISIMKGAEDVICDINIQPGKFDSFYNVLERTPDKMIYIAPTRSGCIAITLGTDKAKRYSL